MRTQSSCEEHTSAYRRSPKLKCTAVRVVYIIRPSANTIYSGPFHICWQYFCAILLIDVVLLPSEPTYPYPHPLYP